MDYPDVVLAFQPLDKVVKEEDCGLLQFTANGASNPSAAISKSWSLPLNVDKVLDIAFARSTAGNGVAVLYEVSLLDSCLCRMHMLIKSLPDTRETSDTLQHV